MGKTDGHQRADPLSTHGQIELALDNQALTVVDRWSRVSPADSGTWLLGTYLSLVNDDPATSLEYAIEGLRRNPNDPVLANNQALALALLRRPDAGRQALPSGSQAVLRATEAAIEISAGRIDEGIDAYDKLAAELERRSEPTVAMQVRLWRNAVLARLTTRDIPTIKIPYDAAGNVYVRLMLALGARRR